MANVPMTAHNPEHAIPCEPLQQDAADDRAERYAHPGCADPQSDGQPTHRRSVEQPDDGWQRGSHQVVYKYNIFMKH